MKHHKYISYRRPPQNNKLLCIVLVWLIITTGIAIWAYNLIV